MIAYEWRGDFANAEVCALHAEGFGGRRREHDWRKKLETHSLGWVCARDDAGLAGFVNVAWDGAAHAFLLDTVVAGRVLRQGVGTALAAVAVRQTREAGCEWLHVDFEDRLRPFYLRSCGFRPTAGGLIALRDTSAIS